MVTGFGYHKDHPGADHANRVGALLERAASDAGHDPATLVAMAQVRATMALYDAVLNLTEEVRMIRMIEGER